MSTLRNLSPSDMANLDSLSPITFTVDDGSATSFVGVWIRYSGSGEEILAYDGSSFIHPFDTNSSVTRPLGDDSLLNFSVVPEHGWLGNIDRVRVQGFPVIGV